VRRKSGFLRELRGRAAFRRQENAPLSPKGEFLRRPPKQKQKQANAIDVHVGRQIRARRAQIGMSQEKLGDELGLTFQQIQKYERGANRIAAGRLFEFAHVLGCSILYFYQGVIDELSGAPLGFAEDAAPPPSPPGSSEAAELSAAFGRIRDAKLRKRILEMVKAIAAESKPGGR
jgi:transcriptional regulator with XRE-family HTH domain